MIDLTASASLKRQYACFTLSVNDSLISPIIVLIVDMGSIRTDRAGCLVIFRIHSCAISDLLVFHCVAPFCAI